MGLHRREEIREGSTGTSPQQTRRKCMSRVHLTRSAAVGMWVSFLLCVLGSDRSPAFGLKEIHMTIQKNGGEPTDRLPTAYTCFNVLLLPRYASKEKLKRLIYRAIEDSEGFGLQ